MTTNSLKDKNTSATILGCGINFGRRLTSKLLIATLSLVGLCGCVNQKVKFPSEELSNTTALLLDGFKSPTLGTKIYNSDYIFESDTIIIEDGHYNVGVEHPSFASSNYERLFSPEGNLLLALAGAQEEVEIKGYAVVYDGGRVKGVIRTDYFVPSQPMAYYWDNRDAYVEELEKWYNELIQGELDYQILYNEKGQPYDIEGIDAPQETKVHPMEFGVYEGGCFWTSDLTGGHITFLCLFKDFDDTEATGTGYLYGDGLLIAKLFFNNGELTKYNIYNRDGEQINEREQIEGDVLDQIFWDMEEVW